MTELNICTLVEILLQMPGDKVRNLQQVEHN